MAVLPEVTKAEAFRVWFIVVFSIMAFAPDPFAKSRRTRPPKVTIG